MVPCVEAVNLVPGMYSKGADVGFEGLNGNRMLDQSITGFDPNRTWRKCSLNHLVSASDDRGRNRKAQRLCSLHVDH
jgi:hypothetical protein